MECAAREDRGDNDGAKVIALDDLRKADQISVHTKNSNYQFSILDPSERKGILAGGSLGDEVAEAVLNGAVSVDGTRFDCGELKTGARAVFFIRTKNHVHRLITSLITDLSLVPYFGGNVLSDR